MLCQTPPACFVELNISVRTDGYLAEVRIDGMFKEQLQFQTGYQLTHWARAQDFRPCEQTLPSGIDDRHLLAESGLPNTDQAFRIIL
jgi:hypothetical protein